MNTIPHGPLESFVSKGQQAQEAIDAALAIEPRDLKRNIANKLGLPSLTVEQIERQLLVMDETLVSVRNASRCSKIEGNARTLRGLADKMEDHSRRVFALAEEIRRHAK